MIYFLEKGKTITGNYSVLVIYFFIEQEDAYKWHRCNIYTAHNIFESGMFDRFKKTKQCY